MSHLGVPSASCRLCRDSRGTACLLLPPVIRFWCIAAVCHTLRPMAICAHKALGQ